MVSQTVAIFQQQQHLICQIFHHHFMGARQRVYARHGQIKIIAPNLGRFKPRRVIGQRHQCRINAPFPQSNHQIARQILTKEQLQLRIKLSELRQKARQQKRSDRRDHPQPEPTTQRLVLRTSPLHKVLRITQQQGCPLKHLLSRFSQNERATRAVQQLTSKYAFQLLDRGRKR